MISRPFAYSLLSLASSDLQKIGNGKAEERAPKVVLGPGSGLGVACLIEHEHAENRLVIPSEGGHATLAGHSDREDAIIRILRKRFGHASAERAISGPGLENIFQAIATLRALNIAQTDAAEITMRCSSRGAGHVLRIAWFIRGKRRADVWREGWDLRRWRHFTANL
jgi:glucokinase